MAVDTVSQLSNCPSCREPADHGRYPAVSGGVQLFASLDALKGFLQFRLDVINQEIYSLMSDIGIFTPTRQVQ
jgi:hypothetical protein